jgi:ribosomal protein S21
VPGEEVQLTPLQVMRRSDEDGESMIRRFTKKVRNDGILREFSDRRHFVKASTVRRRKRFAARLGRK